MTSAVWQGGGAPQRAPRLGPTDRIAPHLQRRGRFARIDPLTPRPLPTWPRVVGAVGWAGLLGGVLYKAWKATRQPPAAD